MNDFRVFLLEYPNNPLGATFLKTFLNHNIPVSGIIIEKKNLRHNWIRFKKKVKNDGLNTALRKILHSLILMVLGKNIVAVAEKNGITVHYVQNFNSPLCAELLASRYVDVLAIVSAPILRDYIFKRARKGCINAHPGWLPKYRGLGSNAYGIQNGEAPGVSVHFIGSGTDTGRIIAREKIPVQENDTIAKINDRALARGVAIMAEIINKIKNDQLVVPKINEPKGNLYKAMPYSEVKKINVSLRSNGAKIKNFHGILPKILKFKPKFVKVAGPLNTD